MEALQRTEALPNANLDPVVAALRGVRKSYGLLVALEGLDLELRRGEVLALLGPNGAGKTTAVNVLLGLTRPDQGDVSLFGLPPTILEARTRVGAMLQVSSVPETLRVREHIRLNRTYYPSPLPMKQILEIAGLEGLEHRLYGTLSGGQKRRVLFALAMCGDPDLLALDEPTVGLDVEARRALWRQIRATTQRGRSVLLTTHNLAEAESLSDRVVVLNHGRVVVEGTTSQVKGSISSRRIRCTTRLRAAQVRTWPGVERVRQDGPALEVFSPDAERVVRLLLDQDPDLDGLEVTGAALEDVFLELTSDEGTA